jgi:peptidoglycan/xylan/chitin deacetylase (PgdA/CDA1 family)
VIWRDDDIAVRTKVWQLRRVNDILRDHGAQHTIAVIAKDIETRPDLLELIRERRMIVQLHCWTHEDLTAHEWARIDLARAVETLDLLFGRPPTVLYPPWNRTNAEVEEAAERLGLVVSATKISLDQFIRCGGDTDENTVNFHHWHGGDVELLEPALKIANESHGLRAARRAV